MTCVGSGSVPTGSREKRRRWRGLRAAGHLVSCCACRHLERQLPAEPDRPRGGLPPAPRGRRAGGAGDQGARGAASADGALRHGLRGGCGRRRPVERRRADQPGRDRRRGGGLRRPADLGRARCRRGARDRSDLWRRSPLVAVRAQRPQGRRPALRLQARLVGEAARGGARDDR